MNAYGNGVYDDTGSFYDASRKAGDGGVVFVPKPPAFYRVTMPIVPTHHGQAWIGNGWISSSDTEWIKSEHAGPIIEWTGTGPNELRGFTLQGLSFKGPGAIAGSKGIYIADHKYTHMRDCVFESFGDQAVHIETGTAGVFERLLIVGGVSIRTGRTDYIGAFEIGGTDAVLSDIESTIGGVVGQPLVDGWCVAILVRSAAGFMRNCVGEISEHGIVFGGIDSFPTFWRVMGCRADLNSGHGFVINGSRNQFIGNLSLRNGQAAHNTYDGFNITNNRNLFLGNHVESITEDANKMRDGFRDAISAASPQHNMYGGGIDTNSFLGLAGLNYNIAA